MPRFPNANKPRIYQTSLYLAYDAHNRLKRISSKHNWSQTATISTALLILDDCLNYGILDTLLPHIQAKTTKPPPNPTTNHTHTTSPIPPTNSTTHPKQPQEV